MATPTSASSPPSHSSPNSAAATPPQHKQTPSTIASDPATHTQHSTIVALAASTSSFARKTQPVLWTQDETFLLIQSYKEKWYAIGRGPLKSTHWEEIAVAVSARSGVDRSSTQCRHKIEKMRKRFRSERQSMGPISIWPFYSQMEELDGNPAPISARPLTRLPPNSSNHYEEEEDHDDNYEDEEEEEEEERQSKSRSINNILRRPGTVNRFAGLGGGGGGGMLSWGQKERSSKRKKRNDEEEEDKRKKGVRAVAAEIKVFAEKVMVLEKKRIEFAKETVKLRKEMEIQRLDLIQNSQTRLLHFLNTAFASSF